MSTETRIRRVKLDLRGSNVPDAFSVDVKLLTAWSPQRIREEAARYYGVPLDQVGPVRKSNGQRVEAEAAHDSEEDSR